MITKTLTLLALLFGAKYTEKADAFGLWSSGADDAADGLIELDMNISQQPKKHLNDAGMRLLNLAAVNGASPEELAYIEKDLYTFYDIQLYANVWVGSQKQKEEMIFDTGSSWVWVQCHLCNHCMANQHKFNTLQSTSFRQLSDHVSVLRYGKGTVYGYDSADQVCITPHGRIGNGCMADYLFKSVVGQRDLEGLAGAGIIGLAPSSQGTAAQLFVPSLYRKGAIKQNVFAMFIDANGQSKIQIGGYDTKKYARGPLHWHPLSSSLFWQVKFDHVRLGSWKFKPSTDVAMADSGTSLNMMPDVDFHAIKNHFFRTWNCHLSPTTLTVCECSQKQHESIPDLEFAIGGRHYRINRDQWFERAAEENLCVIKFMHAPGRDQWIFGLNFFTNYYTVFDYENNRLGFAESVIAGAPQSVSFMRWILQVEKVSSMTGITKMSSSGEQVGPALDSWEVYAKVIAAEALALAFLASLYFGSAKLFDKCQKKVAVARVVTEAQDDQADSSDKLEVQQVENDGDLLSEQHFSQL